MVKKTKRRSYKRVTKADKLRKLFGPLSSAELADKSVLDAILKKAGIKAVGTDIYRIRNQILKTKEEGTADSSGTADLLLVHRTAKQVGGLTNLKNLVSLLERVQK